MPPIDLEAPEKHYVEGRDGQIARGGYPHGLQKERGNFGSRSSFAGGPKNGPALASRSKEFAAGPKAREVASLTRKPLFGSVQSERPKPQAAAIAPPTLDPPPPSQRPGRSGGAHDRAAVSPARRGEWADYWVLARLDWLGRRLSHAGGLAGRRARGDMCRDGERQQAQHGESPDQPHLGPPALFWSFDASCRSSFDTAGHCRPKHSLGRTRRRDGPNRTRIATPHLWLWAAHVSMLEMRAASLDPRSAHALDRHRTYPCNGR